MTGASMAGIASTFVIDGIYTCNLMFNHASILLDQTLGDRPTVGKFKGFKTT